VKQPPAFATRLLRRLVNDRDAIEGDLAEVYQAGRSSWWYWRQLIGVIIGSIVREVRTHHVSVIACLIAGCLVAWQVAPMIVRFTIMSAIRSYDRLYFANGGLPPPHSGDFIWLVNVAILIFTNAAGGFAATRWHRGQRRLVAVMFVAAVVMQRTLLFVWNSTVYDPSAVQLYFMFRPVGATVIALITLESLAALAGGVAGARGRIASAADKPPSPMR